MDDATKRAILAYVKKHDPKQKIVKLEPNADLSGGTIQFADSITQHRIERTLKGEKYVEAYLVVKLVKELDYPIECLELQKEYPAGHPKTDRPRVDVMLQQPEETGQKRLFLYTEAKDPEKYAAEREQAIQNQLYPLADHERINDLKYLMYYTVEFDGHSLVDKAAIIDFELFPDYESWKAAGKPTLDLIPTDYGQARKAVYVNKQEADLEPGERCLDRRAGPSKFAALRNDIHNVLWGGGGMFYNDIFSNLVKLFLAKIYDEETTAEDQPYSFQVQIIGDRPESPAQIFEKINNLFVNAQRQYLGYSDAQADRSRGIDTEKMAESKVAYVVERLQGLSLIENESHENGDVLGSFFEGIVEQGFKQSRGQFFTHRNIVDFLIFALGMPEDAVELVNGRENPAKPRLPFICDPSCGSGTFLIEAMKALTKSVLASPNLKRTVRNRQFIDSMFPKSKPNRWADVYIYGIEINADLALATKVNMVLHGDGNINIYSKDGLAAYSEYSSTEKVSALLNSETLPNFCYRQDVNQQFDFILTNPPFSIKPDEHTKQSYAARFEFGSSAKSENLFLERWYQLLKEGGRIGAVMPESVCDTPSGTATRLFLYRYFRMDAVISLPYLAFKPFTSTKTCLLLATKKSRTEVELFDTEWKDATNRYRKANRRLTAIQTAADDTEIARVVTTLKRDSAGLRQDLAALLNVEETDPESLVDEAQAFFAAENELEAEEQWVFRSVSTELDYRIFFAEAEQVGYKRRRQGGDLVQPNQLFFRTPTGTPSLDTSHGESILTRFKSPDGITPSLAGFLSDFSSIAEQKSLRCDPKYRWFWDHQDGKVIPTSRYGFKSMSEFVRLAPKIQVRKGELSEERSLIELEDVEGGSGQIIGVHTVDEVGSDKVEFGNADIVFSKLEPYLCKAFLNDPEKAYIGSTEWVPLNINGDVAIKEFVWALLVSPIFGRTFRLLQSGKRHARVNIEDFMRIQLPDVPKAAQAEAVRALRPDWKRIVEIRKELLDTRVGILKKLTQAMRGR